MAGLEDNYYGLMDTNVAGLPMNGLANIRTKYNGTVNPNTYKSTAYSGGAIDPTTAAVEAGNGSTAYVNPLLEVNNATGLFGLTNGYWNNMGQAAGLAGSTYNMYDSMFGNKADLYKQQIGNLKDQRAYNAQTIANQKKFKENIGSGFSGAFSNGLAASRVG